MTTHILSFGFCDADSPIVWEPDHSKILQRFPRLPTSELEHFDYDKACELCTFDLNAVWSLSKQMPAVEIRKSDGTLDVISNRDLIEINGDAVDYAWLCAFEHYLAVIIEQASDQAGTLGIWDTSKSDWWYSHSDEGFCVKELEFQKSKNTFSGKTSFKIPMSPIGGEHKFLISSKPSLLIVH